MRLLQLATGPTEMLDLHPNMTIVTGLDDDGHAVLVDAVARLARSEAATGPGLLEAHGVLFDLDPALLSTIEVSEDPLDPIVHPGHLPTQPTSVDARELRSREQAFAEMLGLIAAQAEKQSVARDAVAATAVALEETRRARADAGGVRRSEDLARATSERNQLVERRRQVEEGIRSARPALSTARSSRSEVEGRTASIREGREGATALRSSIEAEVAELDATRHGEAAAEVERARSALQRLEAEIEAERAAEREAAAGSITSDPDEPFLAEGTAAERLERLEHRAQELGQLLAILTPVERMGVEEGLGLLSGGSSVELVGSGEAARLADELDEIGQRLGDPGAEAVDVGAVSLADARARLDDAQQALLEAEQAVRGPQLDRDDVRELEDAHAELLDAGDKADGRFGRARAASRVEELRAAEQEVLDRLGFGSYSDYMMGYSLHVADPVKEEELDRARQALSAAEDEWRALDQHTEAALARAALLDRRRELLEAARGLLGRSAPGGRPQEALRALRVPTVSAVESARVVRAALDAVGVELADEELDHEELALIAEAWLDEADQLDGRRRVVLDELASLEPQRVALLSLVEAEGSAPAGIVAEDDVPFVQDLEIERHARLNVARGEVETAQRRLEAATIAEERRARLVLDLSIAREMEASAIQAAAAADAEMSGAVSAETQLADRLTTLEEELAEIVSDLAEADGAVARLSAAVPDLATLDADIAAAEALHAEAVASVELVDRTLGTLDAEGRAQALEIERLQDIVSAQDTGTSTPAEELEWYLLARLAAQRSVSVAGSVPLVLDNALRGLDGDEVGHLLGRLERMAEAVQVIVISEDPLVAAWAVEAGPARAAVVRPSPR
ncbi:MAG: hypothetical protein ABIY48_08600 [Acidimicrobiales bacterium]